LFYELALGFFFIFTSGLLLLSVSTFIMYFFLLLSVFTSSSYSLAFSKNSKAPIF